MPYLLSLPKQAHNKTMSQRIEELMKEFQAIPTHEQEIIVDLNSYGIEFTLEHLSIEEMKRLFTLLATRKPVLKLVHQVLFVKNAEFLSELSKQLALFPSVDLLGAFALWPLPNGVVAYPKPDLFMALIRSFKDSKIISLSFASHAFNRVSIEDLIQFVNALPSQLVKLNLADTGLSARVLIELIDHFPQILKELNLSGLFKKCAPEMISKVMEHIHNHEQLKLTTLTVRESDLPLPIPHALSDVLSKFPRINILNQANVPLSNLPLSRKEDGRSASTDLSNLREHDPIAFMRTFTKERAKLNYVPFHHMQGALISTTKEHMSPVLFSSTTKRFLRGELNLENALAAFKALSPNLIHLNMQDAFTTPPSLTLLLQCFRGVQNLISLNIAGSFQGFSMRHPHQLVALFNSLPNSIMHLTFRDSDVNTYGSYYDDLAQTLLRFKTVTLLSDDNFPIKNHPLNMQIESARKLSHAQSTITNKDASLCDLSNRQLYNMAVRLHHNTTRAQPRFKKNIEERVLGVTCLNLNNNEISKFPEESINILGSAIRNISHIDLSSNITPFNHEIYNLRNNSRTPIHILNETYQNQLESYRNSTFEKMQQLLLLLQGTTSLRFANNALSDMGLPRVFALAMALPQQLETLDLSGNNLKNLSNKNVLHFLSLLPPKLTALTLSQEDLQFFTYQELIEVARNLPALRMMTVIDNPNHPLTCIVAARVKTNIADVCELPLAVTGLLLSYDLEEVEHCKLGNHLGFFNNSTSSRGVEPKPVQEKPADALDFYI